MSFKHNHNCIFVLFTPLWMQLKQIRCGLVVVWTTLQSYLLISSSEMQTAIKVVISFPVNPNWQKRDLWCMFSTVNFLKGNLASEWFLKYIFVFFFVKDNNSDLASRRCSHDPIVVVFYSRSAHLNKTK